MKTINKPYYKITFTGRLKGAIGKFYKITDAVVANSKEDAILSLYDIYEHVHNPVVKLVNKPKTK